MTPHAPLQQEEHEFEAAPGLPAPLPAGERVLWQGAPEWRSLAVQAFHVRELAVYFGVLLLWQAASGAWHEAGLRAVASHLAGPLLLSASALGLAALLAWLTSRATLYTLTDRRVVMRIGIVLTVTFNLPYTRIEAATLHALRDGKGDIALRIEPATRIAWLHLWPHARPWRVGRPEAMLRSLAHVDEVARTLVRAWSAARGQVVAAVEPRRDAAAAANDAAGVAVAAGL